MRDTRCRLLTEALHTDLIPYLPGSSHSRLGNHWEDPTSVAAYALSSKLLSKCVDLRTRTAADEALNLFLQNNERCNEFVDFVDPSPAFEYILGEVRYILHKFFMFGQNPYMLLSERAILRNINTGKGVVVGGESWATNFVEKVGFTPLTTTSTLLVDLLRSEYSDFPLWMSSIDNIPRAPEIVPGSVFFTVPKKSVIDRGCCKEPNVNMMFMKGIQALLETRLLEVFSIDLKSQQVRNRQLAQKGSITDAFATIDLSSASDLISTRLMELLLPKSVFNILSMVRSPNVVVPRLGTIPLHIFASMGNAFTFPLQTILFAAVVVAVYKLYDIPVRFPNGHDNGNFGVNGDDIIVDRRAYNEVCRSLISFGLQINHDKSFGDGPFRESCGGDYLSGVQVRPVYVKSLRTPQARYAVLNSLSRWGARHHIDLPVTMDYLFSTVKKMYIPPYEGFDGGIHSFHPLVEIGPNESFTYKVYRPKVNAIDATCPVEDERFSLNEDVILLAALGGMLREGKVGYRSLVTRYDLCLVESPSWEYLGVSTPTFIDVELRQLASWQRRNYPKG